MNTLITGGSGLIGSALARRLVESGNQVTVLSRNPDEAAKKLPTDCRIIRWDEDGKELARTLEQCDGVVNLAGETIGKIFWTQKRKDRIISSRQKSGQAIISALGRIDHCPQVLIQASAVGIYGSQGDTILDQKAHPGSGFLPNVCELWEKSTEDASQWGIRRIVIRTGIVLDKTHGALPLMALPYLYFIGGPIGSGEQWLPWIHLDDEVAAIQFLLENGNCSGVYHLSSPEPVNNKEFGRNLAQVLNRPNWFAVPSWLLKIILGQMSSLLLESQRMIPDRLLEAGYSFKYPQLKPALESIFNS